MTSKVDIAALKKAAQGDQSIKVSVTKEWLKAIHSELLELKSRRDFDRLDKQQERELNEGMDEIFSHTDKVFRSMDKMFNNIFKGRSGRITRRK